MLRSARYSVARGFVRPALKRSDDPVFWDAWHARNASDDQDRAARDPANWAHGKQLAMLRIVRSAVARDCIEHLVDAGISATQEDFAELRQQGFAVRPLGERYHHLTPAGIRAGNDCIKAVARRLGLHHITYPFWHCAKCTCGWGFANQEKHGRQDQQCTAAVTHHLADPQAWMRAGDVVTAIIGDQSNG